MAASDGFVSSSALSHSGRLIEIDPDGRLESHDADSVSARRKQLYLLDECLDHLEDRQEDGDQLVSTFLAARLGPFLPGIQEGMAIVDAIDLTFKEQEAYLTNWRSLAG